MKEQSRMLPPKAVSLRQYDESYCCRNMFSQHIYSATRWI